MNKSNWLNNTDWKANCEHCTGSEDLNEVIESGDYERMDAWEAKYCKSGAENSEDICDLQWRCQGHANLMDELGIIGGERFRCVSCGNNYSYEEPCCEDKDGNEYCEKCLVQKNKEGSQNGTFTRH